MSELSQKIEKYYNKMQEDMMRLLDPEINYKIRKDPDNKDIIILENENNEMLFSAKFNYIGIYNRKNDIWYWGWSLVKDKNLTKKSLLVKENLKDPNFKILVEANNFTVKEEDLDNIIKIALYYMKDIWYFVIRLDEDIIQFISIEEILENYI